ncbi:entericidin A/B family lipoprotein [bacterium]|nr:entericidin A/B family lipoprotein [bacterium]
MIARIGLIGLAAALAGCNTVEGVGRDVSAVGRFITGAASDTGATLDGGPGTSSAQRTDCAPGDRFVRNGVSVCRAPTERR